MEYCGSRGVFEKLKAFIPEGDERTAWRYMEQIVKGVFHLHQNGIYHRDLKPSNILVNRGVVKIIDFGISVNEMRDKISFFGTGGYHTPEVVKGEKYSPSKVDVWYLGVLLFRMVHGKHPFKDKASNSVNYESEEYRRKILELDYEIDPEKCSHLCQDLISKMLRHEKDRISLVNVANHKWLEKAPPETEYYDIDL